MTRPVPTPIMHFTSVEHLATISSNGLLCDRLAQASNQLIVEIGNTEIKDGRSRRKVDADPGGVVNDYAPFYFAPRSPMMSSISHGNVPTFTQGNGRLVYLVSTLERIHDLGLPIVISDRNARKGYAAFTSFRPDRGLPEGFVDWELMESVWWNDTDEYPDRRERRMAECLVHERVPWEAFLEVAVKDADVAQEARTILGRAGTDVPVKVRPDWYI